MSRITKRVLVGWLFASAWALAPAMAQHEGHGHGHGDHQHGEKTAPSTSLPKCPVMGEPVNLAVSADTDDGPVFFCCENCISKYKADPAKYGAKVATQRKALADRPKIQVACPVSKEPVDLDVFVESDGKKVYFCCRGCVNKYQREPAKYAAALANSYTYQTQCPVMGEEIDPSAMATTTGGMNVYFCCAGCDKKFFRNPQKYLPKLAVQGYTVDAKAMVHGESKKEAGHDHDSHDHGRHGHGGHDHRP